MGVTISTHEKEAPVAMASLVIGFIGFTFTVATALRVFWSNLQTIYAAPREVQDMLGNLKQALYEEKSHLRRVRRGCRGTEHYDEAAFKTLSDGIRHLMQQFKTLERPFLRDEVRDQAYREAGENRAQKYMGPMHGPNDGPDDERGERAKRHGHHRRHSRRASGEGAREGYGGYESGNNHSSAEKGMEGPQPHHPGMRRREENDYYETDYRAITFWQRFVWVREKQSVITMGESVAKIQIRRIAKQVADLAVMAANEQRGRRHDDEMLRSIDERLSRVVGLRRVNLVDPE